MRSTIGYRRGPPEEDVEELEGAAVNEALRIPAWPPAPLVPLSNEEYNQRPEQPSSEYENCEGDFAEGDEDRTVELWDPSDDKKRKSRTERELPSVLCQMRRVPAVRGKTMTLSMQPTG